MKIRCRKKTEFKVMSWKNGQGVTAEIALFPENAQFPEEAFSWRLSSATVNAATSFSQFPGYERLLTVIEGAGLLLDKKELRPDQVIRFSGDIQVPCELIDGPCVDLGLIYDPKQVSAEMEVQYLQAGSFQLKLQGEVHFLFCSEGRFSAENLNISTGDCLEIEDLDTIEVKVQSSVKLVLISLYKKRT